MVSSEGTGGRSYTDRPGTSEGQSTDVEQRAVYDQSHSTPQIEGDDAPVTSGTNGIQPDSVEQADNVGNEIINEVSGALKKAQRNLSMLSDLGTRGAKLKGVDKHIADSGRFCRLDKLPTTKDGANVQNQLPLNVAPTCRKRAFELAHDYTWKSHRGAKGNKKNWFYSNRNTNESRRGSNRANCRWYEVGNRMDQRFKRQDEGRSCATDWRSDSMRHRADALDWRRPAKGAYWRMNYSKR